MKNLIWFIVSLVVAVSGSVHAQSQILFPYFTGEYTDLSGSIPLLHSRYAPSPDDIRDGVVNVIDPKQIADLLVWARSSKTDLEDGLQRISELPRKQRHAALKELIVDVIGSSGDLTTELLMRSVLKRARYLDDILGTTTPTPEGETLALRILEDSARWAITLYQSDEEFLERANHARTKTQNIIPVDLDFTSLGIEHGRYVLNNLWLSPSLATRAVLIKESISYFYNDLNRDNIGRRNTTIANVLMKVANFATKQGLDKSTEEYLRSIESLSDLEKQNLNRQIEAFYQEQLDKASEAQIERVSSTTIGVPDSGGCCTSDSVLNAKFVSVRPGRFMMGSPGSELNRGNDEVQHEVTLTRGFAIQQTPVTQSQWYSVMGQNPSYFKEQAHCADHKVVNGTAMCPNNPVEQVSWNDVQDFITRLNQKVGRGIYRLPTEAEWEYAARGGSTTAYSFGEGTALLTDYAWYSDNSGNRTHPVCTKKPNPLGLCDMHGNVWEWAQDWYASYSSSSVTDPIGQSGSSRSLRGGSWADSAQGLRAANRSRSGPGIRYIAVGFRLARTSP